MTTDPDWLIQARAKGIIVSEGEPVKIQPLDKKLRKKKTRGYTEAQFTKDVISMAKRYGWKVAHFRCVRIQRKNGEVYYETPVQGDGKGFPDLILVHRHLRRLVALELKVGNNQCTDDQVEWLLALQRGGFHEARCCTDKDMHIIEDILRG